MTWSLYLVRCANGALYTGITRDVLRRFNEHQQQGPRSAKALRGKGPLQLVYQTSIGNHGDALRAELKFKRLSKACKEALLLKPKRLRDFLLGSSDRNGHL